MPFFDLRTFIQVAGYVGIVLVVFADTGLFLGLLLPGDSLLFTAGLLASLSRPYSTSGSSAS
jgi:membrane-associated protein